MKKFKEIREKYRSKFPPSLVAAAVKIALDMGGAMTPAVKKIERMKKGLSDDPIVADALRQANEAVAVKEGKKLKPADQEKLAGLFNSLMGVKHGSPQFKKIKGEIQSLLGEGKYSKYSDLLLMKAKIIDKEGPKSNKLPAVNDAIRIELKKLGIKEDIIQEGTWAVPDTKTKLDQFMNLISKPFFATTPKHIDQYLKAIPFGDDQLYDDLGEVEYEKEADGSLKRPLVQLKKFPKVDLNQIAIDSLNGRWITAKKKGQGYDITHIYFDFNMDEVVKRKSGNLKPKRKMKLDLGESTDTILEIKNKNKELANIKKIIKQLDKVGRDVNNLEGRNLDDDDVNYLMGYLSDAEDVAKDYLQTVQNY